MPDAAADRCTLDPADLPERSRQTRRLTDRLVGWKRTDATLTMWFDVRAADDAVTFVDAESRCCGFFDFDLTRTDTAVRVRVTAPAAAHPLLDALAAAFGLDASGATRDPPR